MDFHTLVRELGCHGEQISRDVNGIIECQCRVVTSIAEITVLHAHLPHHCPQPLLARSEISSLIVRRVEVCRKGVSELLL